MLGSCATAFGSQEAINKATQAAYIQTGLEKNVNLFVGYVHNKYVFKELGYGLLLYKTAKNKQIRFKVDENKYLNLSPYSVIFELHF